LAVIVIALHCVIPDFHAVVFTKENVAAKALSDQIVDLQPPGVSAFGRLLGRMEEGKGQAYSTDIDVPCSAGNRMISHKEVLISTGAGLSATMAVQYEALSLNGLMSCPLETTVHVLLKL